MGTLKLNGYSDDNINVTVHDGRGGYQLDYGTSGATVEVLEPDEYTPTVYRIEYGYDGWEVTIHIPDGSLVQVFPDGEEE